MKNKFEKINTSRLKKMVQGDDLVADSLILLVKNLKKDVTKLKKNLEKKEYDKIIELCHKMKLSTSLISLDTIENEINQLGKKDHNLDEIKFIEYTQKIIKEIEKTIK
jgi:HPt (histidine-containing phosphotransfer) domain-containing protein